MSSAPATDADTIQKEMQCVRAELRDNVKDLVVSAREMTDWTKYVRAYPWLCAGGALALGYLLVPQRSVVMRPDAEGLLELAKQNKLVIKMDDQTQSPKKKPRGLFGELLGMAAAAVLQRGLTVVSQQVTQAMQAASQPQPPPRSSRPGVRP